MRKSLLSVLEDVEMGVRAQPLEESGDRGDEEGEAGAVAADTMGTRGRAASCLQP